MTREEIEASLACAVERGVRAAAPGLANGRIDSFRDATLLFRVSGYQELERSAAVSRSEVFRDGRLLVVVAGGSPSITLHLEGTDGKTVDVPAIQGAHYRLPFVRALVTVPSGLLAGQLGLLCMPVEYGFERHSADSDLWVPFRKAAISAGNVAAAVTLDAGAEYLVSAIQLVLTTGVGGADRVPTMGYLGPDGSLLEYCAISPTVQPPSQVRYIAFGPGLNRAAAGGTPDFECLPFPEIYIRVESTPAAAQFQTAITNGAAADSQRLIVSGLQKGI